MIYVGANVGGRATFFNIPFSPSVYHVKPEFWLKT